MHFQTLRGFRDILPDEAPYWRHILATATRLADQFGYVQIDPPLLEETRLFLRGLQEGSAVVLDKELYSFEDRDRSSISLRPEFTASIMRAYVEHGMHAWPRPVKLFTIGPLFRHEKPQAGRFRQHVQFNAELLGEDDPAADLEIMQLALGLYQTLGFRGLALQINSIGCPNCRPAYIQTLIAYFQPFENQLSEVDKRRLQVNPLRVLDTKEPATLKLLPDAPRMLDHLCDECRAHWQTLVGYLDALALPYEINDRLVRGFDYYVRTVFEIWGEELGAQNALCGGGRYDGLVESVGGPKTPGVGVGIGIDRIVLSMRGQGLEVPALARPQAIVLAHGSAAKLAAVRLVNELRANDIPALLAFGERSLKAQFKTADRAEVRFALIIGDDELARQSATVRDMRTGEQVEIALAELVGWLKGLR